MSDFSLDDLRGTLPRVLGGLPVVAAVYAYGSRVDGRATEGSDLDLAVVLRSERAPSDPLLAERVSVRIASALGTGVEIDTHLAEHLPLPVRGRVVTHGVLLYDADPPSRVEFETATRRRYFDFLPFLERDAREGLTRSG